MNKLLVHKHLIVRAESSNPPTNELEMQNWLSDFISSINMKPMIIPIAKYCNMEGNRGLTAVCIIETSHIAIHCWDEPSPALMQIDVYSCGQLSAEEICEKLQKDFDLTKIEYKFLDRETGLKDLAGGIKYY